MNEENRIRQIVIISGKGGTGKTSVAVSFASLFHSGGTACVIADCDVDAADMHLVTAPELISGERFISGNEAVIDEDNCVSCGKCFDLCRFGAVKQDRKTGKYIIDSTACEGCGVCADNCPAGAISFPERDCGEWMVSGTRYGTMVHAALHPGAENSGHLVTLVRTQASSIAEKEKAGIVLIDGPPGIGCPVIASITG